jgi:hypothetical protein
MRLAILTVLLATTASASPRASSLERDARAAFVRARSECAQPGNRLQELVAERFDATAFSQQVIDGWAQRTPAEQATFVALADRVIGADQRAIAIRQLCAPGRIVGANAQDASWVYIKLRDPDDEDCTSLMFEHAASRWRFRGDWYCGVSIVLWQEFRARHGHGDFATAIDYLRAQLALRE